MLLYRRDEPNVSGCEPVLMKYFPGVFCPIHDFPHALFPALTLLVPASGHKLCCCWLLWLILRSSRVDGEPAARWAWEDWSPASMMGNRAACPAGMPGAPPYPIQAGCSQVCVRQWLGAPAAAWSPVYMKALASFISGRAALGYFWHKS